MRLLRAGIVSLLGLTAACRAFLGREERSGTFTAQVTGAVAATLEGRAGSGGVGVGTGEGYAVSMTAPDGRAIYLYTRSRPHAGSFAVHPFTIEQPPEGYKALFMSEPNGGLYESTAGTVEVAAGSGGRLTGTFRFGGQERPGGPTAVVTGSFTLR